MPEVVKLCMLLTGALGRVARWAELMPEVVKMLMLTFAVGGASEGACS